MKELLDKNSEKYLYYSFNKKNKDELLDEMGSLMYSKGFTEKSYKKAVVERERIYPTGLPVKGINIAIPHTDSVHVKREGILVGVLETPVVFGVMASEDDFIEVSIVFMLAIKDPTKQVEMLQKLMSLCQNENDLLTLKKGEELEKISKILNNIC